MADRSVIIYTDSVVSEFDKAKDPHLERRLRNKLRSFRESFDPTLLDDFEGYKGTTTVKKAKPDQYRAVFIYISEDDAPLRLLQVIKVFSKRTTSSPSNKFLRRADTNGKSLRKRLQRVSAEEIDAILDHIGSQTEADRPQR